VEKLKIALIGVHGCGKSTTGRALAKILGAKYIELEVIDEVTRLNLDPFYMELLFLSNFTYRYIVEYFSNARVIFSAHPIMTIAYSEYWVGRNNIISYIASNISVILPKLDYLIYLKPSNINTIIERILKRGRDIAQIEADKDYLKYIIDRLDQIVKEYGHILAKHVITIDACLELEERINKILSEIKRKEIKD